MKCFWTGILLIYFLAFTPKISGGERDSGFIHAHKQHMFESDLLSLSVELEELFNLIAPQTKLSPNVIIRQCLKYQIDPVFVIAQGQLESALGTKGLAKKTNSIWNVGAFDDYKYDRISNQYKYNCVEAATVAYLELLSTKYLVDKTPEILLTKFVDTRGCRYASDPQYEQKLRQLINKYHSNSNIALLWSRINYYYLNHVIHEDFIY